MSLKWIGFFFGGGGGWTWELLSCSYEVVCSLLKLGSVLSGFGKCLLCKCYLVQYHLM